MRTAILATILVAAFWTATADAAQLSTGYGAPVDGSSSGMLFDITVGGQDLLLTAIGANMQADLGVAVYIRPGTHVGNEFSAAGWTEILDDPALLGNGNGMETVLDVTDFVLSASQTYGVAIFAPDRQEAGVGTGGSLGTAAASNGDLTIFEGALHGSGYSNPFGGSTFLQVPYVVETTIYYAPATQDVPLGGTLVPLLAATLIGVGLWARRRYSV